MKISVLIPVYNASKTIAATLDSVLSQTVPAHEILVHNDGSTDDTEDILAAYKPRIQVFKRPNGGLAPALNFLYSQAQGEIVAFLGHDDLWHPRYLETQSKLIITYPKALGFFTGHEDLIGFGAHCWQSEPAELSIVSELIPPKDFVRRYNETPMIFQMSGSCFPRSILLKSGREAFRVSGAEDTYFLNMIALQGSVVRTSARLVAYRITSGSLSANRLKTSILTLEALELLENRFLESASAELLREFRLMHASRRRNCGKYLMAAGRISEARRHFWDAIWTSLKPFSSAKSLGLFFSTYLPKAFQPQWPAGQRYIPINVSVQSAERA